MDQVNTAQAAIVKRTGKKKLPEGKRRVIISVRVLPSTKDYLTKMGYSTEGRALDVLVKAVQHGGIRDMIDKRSEFDIINLLS